MSPPKLLADEMLGRLARYLRMMGCDTEYARDVADEEVVARGRAEGRIVLTRDRDLARRADRGVWVSGVAVSDQLRQLSRDLPDLPRSLSFDRCTLCNGALLPCGLDDVPVVARPPTSLPDGLALFACQRCGHVYWEGTHTAAVRRHLVEWLEPASA